MLDQMLNLIHKYVQLCSAICSILVQAKVSRHSSSMIIKVVLGPVYQVVP